MQVLAADGAVVTPPGRRARAVLALLALSAAQSMPRRLLAGLLWSALPTAQAMTRLRDLLFDLRGFLAAQGLDLLAVTPDAVGLRPDRVQVDAEPPAANTPGGGRAAGIEAQFVPDLRGIDPQLDDWLTRAWEARGGSAGVAATLPAPASVQRAGARRTRVLVTPPQNLAGVEAAHLDLAIGDAIVAALACVRSVTLLVGGPGIEPAAPDFLLSGNIHAVGQRLRVGLRLVDVAGGAVIWSGQFDQEPAAPEKLAQDIARLVSASLEHELLLLEAERAGSRPLSEVLPAELVLRAVPDILRLDRGRFMQAGRLLEQAVLRDPTMSAAHAWLAYWQILLVGQGWTRNEREALARAGTAAERAILLDPRDARGLTIAGHVRAYLHRQVQDGILLHRRALTANPSLPLAWTLSGLAFVYAGELHEARRHLEHGVRLLPNNPHGFFAESALAIGDLLLGRHEEALEGARAALLVQPNFTAPVKVQVSALGHLGRVDEAAPALRRLLELEPSFSLRRFRANAPFVRREQVEHYARGLRLAGLA
jgi:tetratricopeptide (TPR) repeat protein